MKKSNVLLSHYDLFHSKEFRVMSYNLETQSVKRKRGRPKKIKSEEKPIEIETKRQPAVILIKKVHRVKEEQKLKIDIPLYNKRVLATEASKTLFTLRSEVTKKQLGNSVNNKQYIQAADSKHYVRKEVITNQLDFVIYTDGGYSETKDIGTWAFIIQVRDHENQDTLANWVQASNSGPIFKPEKGETYDTEDKSLTMEMVAVIKAIALITENKDRFTIKNIDIYSDSKNMCEYKEIVSNYLENDWYNEFKRKFIQKKLKEFWILIKTLAEEYNINFTYVKGHSGIRFNEHVNQLCQLRRILGNSGEMSDELFHYFMYL